MNPLVLTESSTAVTGALTSIATEITSTITGVAPVALGVVGAFMVWKFGVKFFKSLAK